MSSAALPRLRPATVAVIGNPNTGKTTLFNALTGLSQKVGNYPGVTVERKAGFFELDAARIELVDLPGTYSLAARSLDEMIAVDVLLGVTPGPRVDAVIAVVDAGNLERNLFLVSQVLELGVPTIVALNMVDGARRRGVTIDAAALAAELGVPVVPLRADRGIGLDDMRRAISATLAHGTAPQDPLVPFPEAFDRALGHLVELTPAADPRLGRAVSRPELLRALVDRGGAAERRLSEALGRGWSEALHAVRFEAVGDGSLAALETTARYAWVRSVLERAARRPAVRRRTITERLDAVLTHRVLGLAILVLALGAVFQAIYAGAAPLMDGIGWCFAQLGSGVEAVLPAGALRSLVVDGVIASAGQVVTFLPQILILFFFLSILEDCGYMARVAFLLDRLLAWTGVSGRAVIPLLSSFACAVPGVMAARTIENRRDRIATILVAPLMSCSARLPVYVLFIGAFVPNRTWLGGWIGLQGLCLLAAHFIGLAVALPVLVVLRRTLLRGPAAPFVMELPDYRWPSWLSVADRLLIRGRAFLVRAGTVIAAVGILVWAASYFPRAGAAPAASRDAATVQDAAAVQLEQSFLGRAGHAFEPVVAPLGWDWRIGVAVLASFPAREVVIASMGTIFGIGRDADENSGAMHRVLQEARRPDGSPLFTVPVGLSLVVFFALCCQCAATLAVIRRETGSAWWAAFAFSYMTAFAWIGAFATYHLLVAWGA